MKALSIILKIALVLVLLLAVGGVILYSVGSKTYTYEDEIQIQTMKQDVYPHLTEPALVEQWLGGIDDVTPIDKDGKPLVDEEGNEPNIFGDMVGLRALAEGEENGMEISMISEVTAAASWSHLETKIDLDMCTVIVRYDLSDVRNDDEPLAPHTRLVQTIELRYKGGYRFMAAFGGDAIKTKMKEDLEALKKLCESGEALEAHRQDVASNPRYPVPEELVEVVQGGSMGSDLPPPPPGEDGDDNTSDDNTSDDNTSDDNASDDNASDDNASDDNTSDDDDDSNTAQDDNAQDDDAQDDDAQDDDSSDDDN